MRVDQSLILRLVDEIQSKNRVVRETGQKYFGVAVISEIADLTPANVRLISISAQLSAEPGQSPKNKAKTSRDLVLEGIVRGDRLTLESTLAGFLMELSNSPMFKQPTISKKSFERYDDKEALTFTARLKLG